VIQPKPAVLEGHGIRLEPLTRDRAKPAVPFGGLYRIVDFTLSNCINSGLRKILVLTQFKSRSLDRHIRAGWSFLSTELGESVEVLRGGGPADVVELTVAIHAIFETPRRARAGVEWETNSGTSVLRRIVSGDDSGDMLKGENARVLAAHVAEQLRQAFQVR